MSNNLLTVNNLKTVFHTEKGIVHAVNGISFSLKKGETVGIVGESGSGKSVTALSIMQLVKSPGEVVEGEIFFNKNGEEINLLNVPKNKIHEYRGNDLAMIFQEPMTSLNPVFRCGNQVVEAIRIHQNITKKEAENQTLALFEKVKLPDPERIFNAYPHELSGGQKQRVMIAMALSNNPSILLADEPTTALDVTVQKTILDLVNNLKNDLDAGILFITHDLGVVAEIADRVLVMFRGKIVEEGTVQEIFNHPKHPYTKSLIACRPPLTGRLKKLPVANDFMKIEETDSGGWQIQETVTSLKSVLTKQRISQSDIQERLIKLQRQSPILEVKNLQTYFSKSSGFFKRTKSVVKAVDDVSFEVFPGETLGLVGESGCGKTTLGRTILRLIEAQSGDVIFQGKNLMDLNEKEMRSVRKDLQIIFQDPYSSLNPRMSIGEAIAEPMKVHNLYKTSQLRKEKTMELLETVQLKREHYYRLPHEFSGGQRQRICIARALAVNPKFIICDECVSALDVSIQAQILNLLIDLRERHNLSYIFISHDLSVVRFISDRMVVMNQGKIEEIGAADQIYTNPKTTYTQRLIAAIPKGF
jgi:peptide/nickel transport system ATP-binding protein